MFERELCKHSAIQNVAYCPHTFNETHHWLKGAVITEIPGTLFAGEEVYRNYGSKHNARAYLEDGIKGNVPDFALPEDAKQLVFRGWDALCEKYAQPVFFEKSPQHLAHWAALSLMLEWAQQCDCQVKFIGLVRNPLGVMYSAQQLFGTNPETRQYGWLNIQKNLLAFRQMLDPGQYHEVGYEALTEHPVEEFTKVCQFIGIDYEPAIGASVHGNSLKKAIEDPAFGLQLATPVRQIAKQFGFRDEDLRNDTFDPDWAQQHVGPSAFAQLLQRLRNRVLKPIKLKYFSR